ncbi:hypothetical protein LOTGIDRAFT_154862 [Lottia gigantea]|uniref:Retinol dehydrogenase 14 n=1 Tax=Lottia gigantea TaxID=225164 RepID=V4B935_LOTGI|nr:hypothetical protein LOTGIDRAFT_154862 [Lottia gigantea]ESO85369.1 hypothetical protein LOTGIDRAFT_154862 [Lottia gigantea]
MIIKRLLTRNAIYKANLLMTGKTAIVTGANVGIGKATALDLARRNARVILACRDLKKAEKAVKDIRGYTSNGELIVKQLDLASLKSVRQFCQDICQEESHLDVLINNAGVFQCPYMKTEDGLEMQMGVNHFGHFLLTNLLLDLLKKSAPSRVVIVSSALLKRGKINFDDINSEESYSPSKGYANSKLANALFARELSQRLQGTGVNVYCLHPGVVATDLGRHLVPQALLGVLRPLAGLVLKTSTEGCQTVVYCSVEPELDNETGNYYGDCHQKPWSPAASDLMSAKKLWEVSSILTGLSTKKLQ